MGKPWRIFFSRPLCSTCLPRLGQSGLESPSFILRVDEQKTAAAVGGLLTAKDAMGRGYANQVMDVTEEFFSISYN